MTVSTDSITGTYQKDGAFWGKVFKGYKTARESQPNLMPRNIESVRCRWKRLCTSITKWVACMDEATRMISSGMNDLDVEVVAQRIWKEEMKEKFSMHPQYRMLCNYPRWKQIVSNPDIPGNLPVSNSKSGEKRPLLSDDNEDDFNTPPRGVHSVADETGYFSTSTLRPPGIKKSKKKGKAKMSEDVESPATTVSQVVAGQERFMELKSKGNMEEERIIEKRIISTLVAKSNITEAESLYLHSLMIKYMNN